MITSVLCKIAELITEIPAEGGLATLCNDYLSENDGTVVPDVVIDKEKFDYSRYVSLSKEDMAYLEAGRQFNSRLLDFHGCYLHASAIELEGQVFLFSGHSGVGKSTHTALWQSVFGEKAHIINDDKPALRKVDDVWYAYGTPFSGKNHINMNIKAPLCGICFLKQGEENRIRRLSSFEAAQKLLAQTFYKFKQTERLDDMLALIEEIIADIPIFELENRPEEAAVQLSYSTMISSAKELGL